MSITGLKGSFCSPHCSTSSPCPTDVPDQVTAKPTCALETQGSSNPTQCALICDPSASNSCGAKASCKPIQNTGVCTYDDGAPGPAPSPPGPAPSPSPPAPPAPAPGPSACDSCAWTKAKLTPLPTILTGVGFGSDTAYAGASYADGHSVIFKTSDQGDTFESLKDANGTLIMLDTGSNSAKSAVAATLAGAEYTVNGGETFKRSIDLGGGQSVESFGSNGYGIVQDEGSVAVSKLEGIAFSEHKLTGIDTTTYPSRYGAYPSENVWYVTLGAWPENVHAEANEGKGTEWEIVHELSELHHIRRNLTTNELFTHVVDVEKLSHPEGTQYTGAIAKTSDGGSTWTLLYHDTGRFYFNGIHCSSETHCVAVAEGHNVSPAGAYIFATVDGNQWYQMHYEEGAAESLMGARMVSETEAWALGGTASGLLQGNAYHSVNGGFNWTKTKPTGLVGCNAIGVDCADGSHCMAPAITVTKQSTLLRFK